jgi:hypothetical protein
VRAEQTVSEMVVETLVRRAEAVSKIESKTFEEAFAEVLKTPAGRRLAELEDGPHRHEKAAEWQAGLTAAREGQRPGHLRSSSENRHEIGEVRRYSRLGRYMERI